jgi:hypothetical protein
MLLNGKEQSFDCRNVISNRQLMSSYILCDFKIDFLYDEDIIKLHCNSGKLQKVRIYGQIFFDHSGIYKEVDDEIEVLIQYDNIFNRHYILASGYFSNFEPTDKIKYLYSYNFIKYYFPEEDKPTEKELIKNVSMLIGNLKVMLCIESPSAEIKNIVNEQIIKTELLLEKFK